MNSFNLTSSEKHFTCSSIPNGSFAGQSNKRNKVKIFLNTNTKIRNRSAPLIYPNMSCADSVTWIYQHPRLICVELSSVSRRKKKQNQKSNSHSHSYSVVDLWDICTAQTTTCASPFSLVFVFILKSALAHLRAFSALILQCSRACRILNT